MLFSPINQKKNTLISATRKYKQKQQKNKNKINHWTVPFYLKRIPDQTEFLVFAGFTAQNETSTLLFSTGFITNN